MPYPIEGSAPWDADLEAEIDAQDALLQAEIDAIPGGGDMLKSDNLAGLTSLPDAQTNLGLGNAATLNVGQDTGTVAAGDDPRIVGAAQNADALLGMDPTNVRVNIDVYSTEEVDTAIIEAFPVIGDPVTLVHGGTGASDAPAARLNLDVYSTGEVDTAIAGVVVGSGSVASVDGQTGVVDLSGSYDSLGAASAAQSAAIAASQPVDTDLTAIAALTTTTYGRAFLALADAAGGRTALGLGTAAVAATTDFDAAGAASTAQAAAIAASQPVDSDLTAIAALTTTTFGRALLTMADAAATKTALSLVKADVGLGSVDNTADTAKPVSTVQQTALDLKANLAGPTFTGTVVLPSSQIITSAVLNTGVSGTAVDVDSTFAANSDTLLASQKAVKSAFNHTTPFLYNSRKLDIRSRNYLAMRNARARVALGSASIMFIGDSITEGSSLTNSWDRWVNRVCDVFANTMTSPSPGVGYVPMATVNSVGITGGGGTPTTPVTNFWTVSGATGTLGANGLGQRSLITAAGSTCSRSATVNCSSFDIYYSKKSTYGGFTVTVDGGSAITVDANGTSTQTIAKWNSHTDGGLTLTSGSHTLAIATTNTGVTNATFLNDIAGVFFYLGNETSGARPYEGGHPTFPSQNTQTRELQQIALIQPDIVFIGWGVNDFAFSVTPTSTAANFVSIITSINGVCTVPPTYVFVSTWGNGGADTEADWVTYRDAIFQQAITSGAAYVDMYERLGWQGSTTTLQDSNHVHPNVAGSKAYTDAVVDALGLSTGQSPDGAFHSGALAGGGSWSISDGGGNSVQFAAQGKNADPFAMAVFGTLLGNPLIALGDGTVFPDTQLSRNSAGVFGISNAIKLAGLTGATQTGRWVGTTADVAPTGSNPFAVGDWVTSRTGRMWTCTVAGSPGTWVEQGSATFAPLASPTLTDAVLNGTFTGTAAALVPLLAGRSGGQTISGGTSAAESLTLQANATNAFGTITLAGAQGVILQSADDNIIEELTAIEGSGSNIDVKKVGKKVTTTNATVTTLKQVTTTTDALFRINAEVWAQRTGGTAGTAGDAASFKVAALFKNVAGTTTQIGTTTTVWSHNAAAYACTIDNSSNSVRVRVTGVANTNITWHGIIEFSVLVT